MDSLTTLILSAISLALIHTFLGPDHYLPFIALSKSNNWSLKKTMTISGICGLAHCLSSVFIGLLGISLGVLVTKLEIIESFRGDIASYLLIAFGLVYLIWSLKNLAKGKTHSHKHKHDGDSHAHIHAHNHKSGHLHTHKVKNSNLFWGIFIVFLFGPCEPLIPLLMYPSVAINQAAVIIVASVFTFTTVATMLVIVAVAHFGLDFVKVQSYAKYAHSLAASTIVLCGILIVAGL